MTGIERHWEEQAEREAVIKALEDADRDMREASGKFLLGCRSKLEDFLIPASINFVRTYRPD